MSDKIEEIRARHQEVPSGNFSIAAISLAHADRAILLAEVDRQRAEIKSAKADAWDEGYQDHGDMIAGIARKPSNPYR